MRTFFASPLITEKSMAKAAEGMYTFIVPTWAVKRQIAEFVTRQFGVTVASVTTSKLAGKNVRFKSRAGQQSTYKKATVRLTKGQTIADFSMPVESPSDTTPTPTMGGPEGELVTESKITVRSKTKKSASSTEEK